MSETNESTPTPALIALHEAAVETLGSEASAEKLVTAIHGYVEERIQAGILEVFFEQIRRSHETQQALAAQKQAEAEAAKAASEAKIAQHLKDTDYKENDGG